MVHGNQNIDQWGREANNMRNKKSKRTKDTSVAADDDEYDSADDILDPKTEIQLVNVKSDETLISDYESGLEAQTIHEIIEQGENFEQTPIEELPVISMTKRCQQKMRIGMSLFPHIFLRASLI